MNFEEKIILEHFETPDSFELEIHVSYKNNLVKVTCINKQNNFGSAIDASVSRYDSKMGTVIDTIIDNIKATLEIKEGNREF